MANLYYREDLPASAFAVGATVEIAGDEARHAVRVSRLRVGERILVGNGAGTLAEGVAERVDRDCFAVRVERAEEAPDPAPRLVLVQALAKGDRDERAVEQATEFGVDLIIPWQAARSVSRWDGDEKAAKGAAKWRRVAREASKQALRPRMPVVAPPVSLDGLCGFARAGAEVLVLHPGGELALSAYDPGSSTDLYLVVGPEGGIDGAELDALAAAGARILRLGDTVLRTSSAGPAALALLNVALGRW